MKKICAIVVSLVAAAIIGCYWSEDLECYGGESFATIDYFATSDFDSAHIYLGDDRICRAGQNGSSIYKFCKTFLDSGYKKVDVDDRSKCLASDAYLQWSMFSCSFNEKKDGVNMEIADLTIEVFNNNFINKTVIKNFNLKGLTSGLVPVSDTTNFLENERLKHLFVASDYPKFRRMGCYDGLCVFQDKFPAELLCFEK